MRRFSPPLPLIVSFIGFLVFRYDSDNYRCRYHYRRFFGLIVSKCYLFRYPTLVWVLYDTKQIERYDWSMLNTSGPVSP